LCRSLAIQQGKEQKEPGESFHRVAVSPGSEARRKAVGVK
jgi:hypothetical protein